MAYLDNDNTLYNTDGALFQSSAPRYSFASALLDSERLYWNKRLPYQLAVLKVDEKGSYSIHNKLIFTLPINPEALTVSTPFAITASATLGGVVEQHGGAPFRQIQFSGTFGVVNDRPSGDQAQGGVLNALGGIAAGTVQGLRNVGTAAASLGAGEKYKANLSSEIPSDADIKPGSTGYYQFRMLQRFLESYVEAKKTTAGRGLRLALFVWKDEAAYIVTPLSFDVSASAASPFERKYSLRLQAWKRVDPKTVLNTWTPTFVSPTKASRGFSLARAHAIISNATRLARAASNTLRGFRADLAKVFDTMRQVALFCSAVGGIVRTAADLPAAIRADFTAAVEESWDIVKGSFDGLDPDTKATITAIDSEVTSNRAGGRKGSETLRAALADDGNSGFLELVKPDRLNLSPSARAALDAHVAAAASMTSDDFRAAARQVLGVVNDFADAVGLGNATYDQAKGRSARPARRPATMDDFRAMHALAEAAEALQSLVINTPTRQTITAVEYVAGLASANGIEMRVPRSKFAVPFPYGSSLERLAAQYLGNPARWLEIAELNNLRAPYVDETGHTAVLIAPGNGNTVVVGDAAGLLLGQLVRIWSNTTLTERRRVVGVTQADPTTWYVVLDGDSDLSKYKAGEGATIQWFTAGTVNSQQIIYIPSDSTPNPDILKYVPNEDDINRVLTVGEVDGMLTDTGDLVVTPDGDWPFVFGYSYLVQWARVTLNTPVGSLSMHPAYGVSLGLGDSVAEADASAVLRSLNDSLSFNPSFTGVLSALVDRKGPTTRVVMEAGVRQLDALLPISFDVKS